MFCSGKNFRKNQFSSFLIVFDSKQRRYNYEKLKTVTEFFVQNLFYHIHLIEMLTFLPDWHNKQRKPRNTSKNFMSPVYEYFYQIEDSSST